MDEPVELHVVSDSTGETAARVVEAVEAQFPGQEFEVVRHPRIAAPEDVHLAAARARGRRAVVLFTLVEPELREAMRALCKRYRLHYCDLLGHPIEAVARVSGSPATRQPGARSVLDSSYFKRISAIEFAVRYDDGAGSHQLAEADVVLVGVSRSSKTPLSMYLAYLAYKTANVPIVKGIEPPAALWKLDPAKVVPRSTPKRSRHSRRRVRAWGEEAATRIGRRSTSSRTDRSTNARGRNEVSTSRSRNGGGSSASLRAPLRSAARNTRSHLPVLRPFWFSSSRRPFSYTAADAGVDGDPVYHGPEREATEGESKRRRGRAALSRPKGLRRLFS